MRLAVATDSTKLPDPVADDAHRRAAAVALDWQERATHARFWEMTAVLRGAEENRAYELAGLMASTGEQLALALSAAVEVALWLDQRARVGADETHEMAMRGMAEAQCLFVLGTGHALANVAVRALAFDKTLLLALLDKVKSGGGESFTPFSEARADWVPLSRGLCEALQTAAQHSEHPQVHELVRPVVKLGLGDAWGALLARRAEDFHRWRPQSHGIQGVSRRTPWTRTDTTRSLTLESALYEDAGERGRETAGIATDAMLRLAAAMRGFADHFPAASNLLGGPPIKSGRLR